MPQDDGQPIIIVGDLHLAGGRDPITGAMDPHEQFFHDDAFARFLDDVRTRAEEQNCRPRLLILGDFFDFLRVRSDRSARTIASLETSDRATQAKMELSAAGHPSVFAALARFVSAGLPLEIVPGNHDIELVRSSTQEGFKNLLMRFGCLSESVAHIRFHPWIYFVPGLLYAEHGHQYHDINAFITLLEPFRHQLRDEIDLPPGSFLDLYLQELFVAAGPSVRGSHLTIRALIRAFRVRPALVFWTLPQHMRYLGLMLRSFASRVGRGQAQRRAVYRKGVLQSHADQLGLSHHTLVAIDELSARTVASMWPRLLRKLVLAPLSSVVARLVGRPSRPTKQAAGYLHQPAAAIHELVEADGHAVPFYAFGHTHRAEKRPLVTSHSFPYYLNSGSWIVSEPTTTEAVEQSPPFTFVEIDRALGGKERVARVMVWDDAAGHATPVPIPEAVTAAAVLS